MKYSEAIKNADALRALGQDKRVWLATWDNGDAERPWHLPATCRAGGSHRLEISTSAVFSAFDPVSRLTFEWDHDIEPRSASGKGGYEIDTDGIGEILSLMHPSTAKAFRKYLAGCAVAVQKKAKEWRDYADRQMRDADTLRRLAAPR
jgi:hypothetical protein